MKRPRTSRQAKQTADVQRLIKLSNALSSSSSRLEDDFWDIRLVEEVNQHLANSQQNAEAAKIAEDTLMAALEPLYQETSPAYGALVSTIETCVEARPALINTVIREGKTATAITDALMIAIPLLAWSRFPIPSGKIQPAQLSALRLQLQIHVLAKGATLSLCDQLWSPDQLPQTYVETAQLANQLTRAALQDKDVQMATTTINESIQFLSDSRYIVGAIAAPQGAALFRWQQTEDALEETPLENATNAWTSSTNQAIQSILRTLLPACAVELQPVRAYHAALLSTDRASRPWSICATIAYLQTAFNLLPNHLMAVVARFNGDENDEYRISLITLTGYRVIHGVVWPLLETENDDPALAAEIEGILKTAGIQEITILNQAFSMESCDDCGLPLYPDPEGNIVHIETPDEQNDKQFKHLH